mmetsp:Transcript_3092/g.8386  ORF Transcript_3092/g.8386 Transcript_3092/m.8386 type:complete len:205 (-) Transcript_3092:1085-1699(-)
MCFIHPSALSSGTVSHEGPIVGSCRFLLPVSTKGFVTWSQSCRQSYCIRWILPLARSKIPLLLRLLKLFFPLFEPMVLVVCVQILVPVPLMGDGAEGAVPVVDLLGLVVIQAPLPEFFRSQGTQVVDDTLALFPHHEFRDVRAVGELAGIIEVIVESLVGPRHLDVRLVPLVDQRPQVDFDGLLLSHRRPAADCWLIGESLEGL